MSKVAELFGHSLEEEGLDWPKIIQEQQCPFLGHKCYKVRKSDPKISIGTCVVRYGTANAPIVICPTRLLERRQVFLDCFHLLTLHEPGNELHVVREVGIPGGNVDFFLVSVRNSKVVDFAGIELQTLDTTGSIWPQRQRAIQELGIPANEDTIENKSFGMNWKMTAKTILVQMHHKIATFEGLNKKLVLVVQDVLLGYMSKEFNFSHLSNPALLGDSMHFHAYSLKRDQGNRDRLSLVTRASTDMIGLAECLGLKADARVGLEMIVRTLESKISPATQLTI